MEQYVKKKEKTEYPGGMQYKNARKYQYQTKNEHSPSYYAIKVFNKSQNPLSILK